MRTERDLLGSYQIDDDAYYGVHSARARENFPLSGRRLHPELVKALAMVKQAAARANRDAGLLPPEKAEAIEKACAEIAAGGFSDQFITDALQGGAGTSANMNANEVIANRAIELLGGKKGDYTLVHPIDDVNRSQSTNDVFPTAVRVAAIRMLKPVSEGFARLQTALQEKEEAFSCVLKIGRTELQDAVPITLGQEFGAWAQAVARDRWRLYKVEERLRQVNLGGTAVGTGLNAPRAYVFAAAEHLRELTGLGLARAEDPIDPTQNCDVFAEVSGLLKAAAVNLAKIAGDLRLLSSGPRAGFGEIHLPAMQAGSSIMPGKVNPVIPEAVTQAAYQIMADDLAVTLAAQAGNLELNAFLPLIAKNLLEMLDLMRQAVFIFTKKCVAGIEPDRARCAALAEQSPSLAAALIDHIGYDAASRIAKDCLHTGKTVRQALLEDGRFTPEEIDRLLDPIAMTSGRG
ncbi:aspartate ammonia-lyase [Ethanoligenens harbinense]|uniref:Fumarate lyase n=1 Tax=Ethanoligenens harbinense (strain DSM 18485 / JCM 12961 / CGMCC 1.5033 / YUAN-3) TaxID=663278 RepID=E6U5H2_ETHHY|nr:aspartate ammonia-lyase [Ethanoligenens harbinense]ADU25639.1 fumarate lyase [Ethanoligenens harbinense YUAN-3]AVQ94814.1 aspartate ammonia-lyase [Ethanoligenens harbinense YUAN-3]AYF37504.1 aspartate ammonia-lyase [Ethanoligenens harbinense]AYF40224.1 aspartate ammonia-lyase [Ethanoligenens harbinense]QCN91060.1 aspartate ammonia-lyase [Ethanoligenens harbinense]